MDARVKTVREILHSGDQYLIPFFQRQYSWTHQHWERLRADVWALMEDSAKNQHFLGPLVCTPTEHVPAEVTPYQLIDGQQRLATLTVMLAAVRDIAKEHKLYELADEITENYLVHKRRKGLHKYKVVPRVEDRDALIGVIEENVSKEHRRLGIIRAWKFFCRHTIEWAKSNPETKLRELFSALSARLSLVVITIDGENPYEIFESLNSTGLSLEESDLIRNYIFMNVLLSNQEEFHVKHWEPFEGPFDEDEKNEFPKVPLTPFYRDYLMREGLYSKTKATFIDFKKQYKQQGLSPEDQVAELRSFAQYELLLRRPGTCESEPLRKRLSQIETLEITTAHPLLMNLMDRHKNGQIDEEALLGCLDDLASFVIRRTICGESTRAYGRWFPEAIRGLKDNPCEDLRQYWLRRGWPDDATFIEKLQDFPLYRREGKKCRLILDALEESYGHKEKVDPGTVTIEHVMPQTIGAGEASDVWRATLGEDWIQVHEKWLHSIGNLTLSGYHKGWGNQPFAKKQGEMAKSNLVLNKYFSNVETWNEQAIKERSAQLAGEVAQLWLRPVSGPAYVPSPDARKTTTKRSRVKVSVLSSVAEEIVKKKGDFEIFPSSRGLHFVPEDWLKFLPENATAWKTRVPVKCWFGIGKTRLRLHFEACRMEDETLLPALSKAIRKGEGGFKANKAPKKYMRFWRATERIGDNTDEEEIAAAVEKLLKKAEPRMKEAGKILRDFFSR